jgi:hypothetical protein
MQSYDLQPFTAAMTGTFEAFSARPPTGAGLDVWFRTLKEFPVAHVVDAFDSWARRSNRPPTAAQIADACYERGIREREAQTEKWRKEEELAPQTMGATPAGRRAISLIRQSMRAAGRSDPHQWARNIVQRYTARDDSLSHIAFTSACEVLGYSDEEVGNLKALRARSTKRVPA